MASVNTLPLSAPEAQGISSAGVIAFLEAAQSDIHYLHSFMLLRRGHTVAQGWWAPYAPQHPHMLFSLSKSFTSTAVGLAAAEGRLSLDDRVAALLPDDVTVGADDIDENFAALRVRDLLTMSSGHDPDTFMFGRLDGNWAKGFLAQPFKHAPGVRFWYENGASYALSAIVQRVTGMTMLEYLRPRLLEPLGIADGATWTVCPRGINTGFTGLSLTTEGIARFGQLYLQRGVWQGKRLLPEAWVEEATRRQTSTETEEFIDARQGYGYQFWRCRHNAYNGHGAFGQYCVVMPDLEVVLVTTGGKEGMHDILELAWRHLLSAMKTVGTLPEDRPAQQALNEMLAKLSLAPPQGDHTSPIAARVSERTYFFGPNDPAGGAKAEALCFDFGAGPFHFTLELLSFDFSTTDGDDSGCLCTLRDDRKAHSIACGGNGQWRKGTTTLCSEDGQTSRLVAVSGAWTTNDTYVMILCFIETAFRSTLTCRFAGDTVTVDWRENASFGYPWHEEANLGYAGDAQLVGRVIPES